MTGEKNELLEVIENAIRRASEDLHTFMPGRIESYDYRTQKATVKPLLKKRYLDGDVLELPVLGNVPVIFPRTGTAGITFPVKKGDKVGLIFAERSLERWYLTGEDSEPGDRRRYDLSDAVAIPGLYSFAEKNIQSNNSDVEVHNDGQRITIKANGDIELGVETLKKLVNDSFKSVYENHVHNYFDVFTVTPYQTSTPATNVGIVPKVPPPAPIIAAGFESEITSAELTKKVTAQ